MFARIVTMRPRVGAADQLAKSLEEKILPMLRNQDGFKDEICLLNSDKKKAVVISFWERQEQAENYAATAYPQILATVKHLIEEAPIIKNYDVLSSTFHTAAVEATV